jgi:hypothetical protein
MRKQRLARRYESGDALTPTTKVMRRSRPWWIWVSFNDALEG